ncbi:hypothetical protein CSC70_05800 [Pseudoxanthomonas kalamensis DSM 18571]|uniref:DUF2066 domain-containing protein n=1 Tax=Pseudoxanthomonas kalamensis TaxID=289483 RepID=UPI0013916425|nr:DUF2066 domain-containing protein [Pseudoxanthomonas kalamensis]KAF1711417.1 hypothetical protein CSC70_05800 [Pseudoxanthomonas kalamensis DSM 18571]
MRRIAVPLTVFALTLFAGLAWAQSGLRTEGDRAGASGVYEAEVPVASQSDTDLERGMARALGVVLGKISGDRNAMGRPGVAQELRRARDYIDSYDFRQDQGSSPGGAPTYRTMLVARFKPTEVDALAGVLGLPVWPQPRPKPVAWLAIDDGSGPRLAALKQANAVRPLLSRAIERGYRLGLPAGNAAEQALVGAIWRQDTAAVARASSRYQPPMQLIGKLYRSGGGWRADWVFVDNGKVLSKWSASDSDARRAMVSGADGAADALIKRYRKAGGVGTAGKYRVAFTGIDSTDDYLRLSGTLQKMSVVRGIRPLQATPGRLELELELLSGLNGFRSSVDPAVLVEVPVAELAEGEPTPTPEYRLY